MEGEKGSKRGVEKPKKGVNEEFAWLKDTRWNWNDWREVGCWLHEGSTALCDQLLTLDQLLWCRMPFGCHVTRARVSAGHIPR